MPMNVSDLQPATTSGAPTRVPAPEQNTATDRAVFMRIFWVWTVVLLIVVVASATFNTFTLTAAGVVVISAAWLPVYLWCKGKAHGLPLFPLFSITFIWTHGLQLLLDVRTFENYPDDSIWLATETVAGFLLLGTLVWVLLVRRPMSLPRHVQVISEGRGDTLFRPGL